MNQNTSSTITRPRDVEAEVRERFDQEAGAHRMRVFHDDGVYRHLRFNRPGTWCYGYDLVTWPGFLTISGDVGDYTFSRVHDMFSFFRGGRINPDYWAQKIPNRDAAAGTRRYRPGLVKPRVMEWYDDYVRDHDLSEDEAGELRAALDEQVFWYVEDLYSRDRAVGRLMEFEWRGPDGMVRLGDWEPYEWTLDEWDHVYLWSCWAIVQGIAQYDWAKGWT